jgi:hypothetical protein
VSGFLVSILIDLLGDLFTDGLTDKLEGQGIQKSGILLSLMVSLPQIICGIIFLFNQASEHPMRLLF